MACHFFHHNDPVKQPHPFALRYPLVADSRSNADHRHDELQCTDLRELLSNAFSLVEVAFVM